MKNVKLYSAFCGTGKSYLCKNYPDKFKELEDWLYRGENFPKNYVEDVVSSVGTEDILFISTDPVILRALHEIGIDIELVYPENSLRNEYLDRYIERDSPYDFIGTIMKNWNIWIDELKEQDYCTHTVLRSGEYVGNLFSNSSKRN